MNNVSYAALDATFAGDWYDWRICCRRSGSRRSFSANSLRNTGKRPSRCIIGRVEIYRYGVCGRVRLEFSSPEAKRFSFCARETCERQTHKVF